MTAKLYIRLLSIILAVGFIEPAVHANTYDGVTNDATTGIHRVGNYNVRYTNDDSDVTNGWSWSNRKDNLLKLIQDIDFDLLGLEEVTGSTSQGNQLTDITNMLYGKYRYIPIERDNGEVNTGYSFNILAFKKDRYNYTEGDYGYFWLSSTPDTKGSAGWEYSEYGTANDTGSSIRRTCIWVKLEDKATGTPLLFAMAHTNAGKLLDGPESGKLITARLQQYADELADEYGMDRGTVPVILVGDFNMDRRRGVNQHAYREYLTYFSDAALAADKKVMAPYKSSTSACNVLTTVGFDPITSITSDSNGSIFDYVFYRNVHAQSQYIITEHYGAGKNPSDHFPVYINFTLGHNAKEIYVNAKAAAGGDGTKASPFTTLTEAKKIATAGSTVYVTADTYNESFELSSPVKFIGGYDSWFENIIGKTTLDGSGKAFVVKAKRNGLYFSNFKIINTVSTGTTECGAFYSTGAEVRLDNCEFSDNTLAATTSLLYGAGLHTAARDIELTNCYFHSNKATAGSALAIDHIDAGVSGGDWGAETVRVSGCTFADNSSVELSGTSTRGAVSVSAGNCTKNINFWNNTFANNTFNGTSGGGTAIYVYCESSTLVNFAHNTVVGNASTSQGAATFFVGGTLTLLNNLIVGNFNARTDQTLDQIQHDLYADDNKTTIASKGYNIRTTSASFRTKAQSDTDFYAESDGDVTNYERGLAALTEMIDGYVKDGKFVANLATNGGNTPTVKVNQQAFDGRAVNVLTKDLRALEAAFGVDINGDGDTSDALTIDQRGSMRMSASVPGACEFVPLPLTNYFIIPGTEGRGTQSGYSWATAAPESKLPELLANAKPGSTFHLGVGVYELHSNYFIPEGIALKGGYTAAEQTGRNTTVSYDGSLDPSLADAYKTIFDAKSSNGSGFDKAGAVPFFIIGNPNARADQYPDYFNGALNTGTKTDADRVMLQGITIRNAVKSDDVADYQGSAILLTNAILRLSNVVIEDNSVSTKNGGVVAVRGAYLYAADCVWRNNSARAKGVALTIHQKGTYTSSDETDRSVVVLDRCEFSGNTLYPDPTTTNERYGGVIMLADYGGALYMNNCTGTGINIYSIGSFARIGNSCRFVSVNNTFYNCTADNDLKGILSMAPNSQTYIANTICVNPTSETGTAAVMWFQDIKATFTSGDYNVWGSLNNPAGSTLASKDKTSSLTTSAVFGSNTLGVDGGNGSQVIAPLSAYSGMKLADLRKLVSEWSLPDEFDVTRDQRGLYRGETTYCGAYDLNATEDRLAGEYFVSVDGTGDGSSWDTPLSPKRFSYLLENAPQGDKYYLQAGTYLPIFTNSSSASSATYRPWIIPEGVFIRGGYTNTTGTDTDIAYPSEEETVFTADYDGDGVGDNGDLPFFWFDNSTGSKDDYATTTIEGITIRDAFSTCEDRKYYRTPIFIEHADVEFGWCKILNNTTGYLNKYEADYYQLSPKEGYESKGSSFALPATYTTPVYEVVGAGGAMTVRGSKVYLHDCIWRGNKTTHGGAALAIRQRGGTVSESVTDRSVVTIERNEFTDNTLPVQGVTEKEPELDAAGQRTGYYKYHELARYGGAILLADYGGKLYMINSTVSGSHVQYAGGAVRIGTGGEFYSMSNTFFDCTAPTGGGAILSIGSKTTCSISNTIAVNAEADMTDESPIVRIQSGGTVNRGGFNVFGSIKDENNSSQLVGTVTGDEPGITLNHPFNDIRATNTMETVFVNNLSEEAALAAENELGDTHFDNTRYPGYDYLIANERHTAEAGAMDSYVITPKKDYYAKYYMYTFNNSYGWQLIEYRSDWDIESVKGGVMDLWRDQRKYERTQNTIVGAYDPYAIKWTNTTETQSLENDLRRLQVVSLGNGLYRISGVEGLCRVYDLAGHIISTDEVAEGSVIDLSAAAAGLYIINVDNQTAKIVK